MGIAPFSPNFRQCKGDYDPQARKLLELTLKACLVAADGYQAQQVLQFSVNHNYLLAIDEQTVWYLVKQTQEGMILDADYSLISMLLDYDIIYKIQVSDANRNAIYDPYKGEEFNRIIKEIAQKGEHAKDAKQERDNIVKSKASKDDMNIQLQVASAKNLDQVSDQQKMHQTANTLLKELEMAAKGSESGSGSDAESISLGSIQLQQLRQDKLLGKHKIETSGGGAEKETPQKKKKEVYTKYI